MKFSLLICIAIGVLSCKNDSASNSLKQGTWRASLQIDDSHEIPFGMAVNTDNSITFKNGEERVEVTSITYKGDSIFIEHPVFEGILKGVFTKETVSGTFIKSSLDREMPFVMQFGDTPRFEIKAAPNFNITGNWETTFSPDSPEDIYIAKGIFTQEGNTVLGTFRTTTGDYRYLEGVLVGNTLQLSTFDGAHAFLFEATVSETGMTGVFYSGNHWKEPFVAKANNTFRLPDPEKLTYLNEGFDKLAFNFKDTNRNFISFDDDRFKDKVVLVQIMGTWCPNCLDETKYFSKFYKDLDNDDFEIIALAFEYAKTEESAMKAITKLKTAADVPYPILLAQYGTSSKKKANEKLPMLNHVLSYPTTLFIDKKGTIRKIHTGFNGPATGQEYTKFTKEFELFVGALLKE